MGNTAGEGIGKDESALEWLSLVGAIWLQSINGTNFDFPSYSTQLKKLLSMSQLQLNILAFASDAGKLFGWVSGVAANRLPLWMVLLIGSSLGLLGYGVQVLFLTHKIPSSLSYWHLFLLTLIAGNSICWINTVCFLVAHKNFSSRHQMAVGLSTSYQGLSAKIYTDIVNSVLPPSAPPNKTATAYLILNTFLPLIVCIISMPAFLTSTSCTKHNHPSPRTNSDGRRRSSGAAVLVLIMYGVTLSTGVFAVVSTSLGSRSRASSIISYRWLMIGLAMFLAMPLVVPVAAHVRQVKRQLFNRDVQEWNVNDVRRVHSVELEVEEVEDSRDGVVLDIYSSNHDGALVVNGEDQRHHEVSVHHEVHQKQQDQNHQQRAIEEIGVKLMLQRLNFWLYFFSYLFGATIGFVFLNNLGQIAESRGFPGADSLVSLSSSFGFFGRLLPSVVDYVASRWRVRIPRPACMAALLGPMSGAFFLLVVENEDWILYVCTASIGVCTGAITSISVSVTAELFGSQHFSVNHNILVANIPVGSFVFGSLAAVTYSRQGAMAGTTTGDKCIGTQCYNGTFLIWGSLCFLATFLTLCLYRRTRNFYDAHI